jgi:Tfp pilus assembly protein PilN
VRTCQARQQRVKKLEDELDFIPEKVWIDVANAFLHRAIRATISIRVRERPVPFSSSLPLLCHGRL